ncbi:hypothetical protein ACIGZJ_17685 [Kitasatospora sp. NPDC052868]|uniref:hypothetical protein n=1 Tax=Kitasatospora sp. NPDC052868 TaxID=3364060 RepID=UPI0037C7F763
MQFTSGGTHGPRFDVDGYDLRLGNNVYGFLPSAVSALRTAQAFHTAGWRVRMSNWTDYEVEHTYAELELCPDTPVRFAGVVVPAQVDDLLSAFAALGLSYTVELYDQDDNVTIYRS